MFIFCPGIYMHVFPYGLSLGSRLKLARVSVYEWTRLATLLGRRGLHASKRGWRISTCLFRGLHDETVRLTVADTL